MSSKPAFDAACDFLSIRERSEKEVSDKLREKGYSHEEIETALVKLKELKFIDDPGFAKRYVEYLIQKGRGMRRIRNELRQKGIAEFDLEDIIYELQEEGILTEESGKERAMELAMKVVEGKSVDDKLIARVARRLQTQGYQGDEVYYVINRLRDMKNSGACEEMQDY